LIILIVFKKEPRRDSYVSAKPNFELSGEQLELSYLTRFDRKDVKPTTRADDVGSYDSAAGLRLD